VSEETPTAMQRALRVIRSPKRLTLALLRRSPLRSTLSRLELVDVLHEWNTTQQRRIDELERHMMDAVARLQRVDTRQELLEQQAAIAAGQLQLIDVHHGWFSGVQSRANAHHEWIVGQQQRIELLEQRMGEAVTPLQLVGAHHEWITGHQKRLDELHRQAGTAVARANIMDLHLGDYAARIETLEQLVDIQHSLLHFQNFQRVVSQQPAPANAKLSLLFDIRITQIERRERGISRYTASLALALGARLPGKVSFLIDPGEPLPDQIDELRACGHIINGVEEIPALPSVSHFLQGCIFNLSNTVEDLFPIQVAAFQPKLWAICYDLVPLIFPEEYLQDRFSSIRYSSFIRALPFVDRHLAISQTTGRDLTRLVGILPSQVYVIMGGIDTHRWPADVVKVSAPLSITNEAGETFHLSAPFWLYVGGNDFRKNLKGLIEAFALLLKAGVSPAPQLVIACHIPPQTRDELYAEAAALGLEAGRDLVITGWIDDPTLSLCYRAAFATIFPSLYEGLGLPVLESYFFGTPALASDSSSLQEITAPECRFDPTQAQSIADAMLRMHQDPALPDVSLAWGKEMLKLCDWAAIANRVALLLDEDLQKRSQAGSSGPT